MLQSRIDSYMLSIAHLTASMSKATRLKVGAVFARDGRPLCTGWNGVLEGSADDSCEHIINGQLTTKPTVIHAEMNALRYMARAGISTDGATLYLTHAPCINCAKHLAGIGLKQIIYSHAYRSSEGTDYLKSVGIDITQLEVSLAPISL